MKRPVVAAKKRSDLDPSWPVSQAEVRAVASLLPYARNAKTHSPEQVEQIAASIREFGWTQPVLVAEDGTIIAGHGRVLAAQHLGIENVPVLVARGWSDDQRRAYTIADNKLTENGGWDEDLLRIELGDLNAAGFDVGLLGFDTRDLTRLLADESAALTDPDDVPEPEAVPVSGVGDVWVLGEHRAMCGDSTNPTHVAALMGGEVAYLLHADPPYGMGKQADGVANDNIYGESLDRFQMSWWSAFRPFIADNASAYIWGNAADLWRLWYAGGLCSSERLEMRNEIVWDKKSIAGMASPDLTQYPMATERCLFFQIGAQFLGNINADDFPEAWEPVRSYLEGQAKRAGIGPNDVKRVCNCGMYGHWFSRSQFTLIPEKHYGLLAAAFPGAFTRSWASLKAEWDNIKGTGRQVINGKLEGMRAYFDNAHDIMRDVWEFPRVTGQDRHSHATPKPVAMMERLLLTSLPEGGLCAEPFGGSGSTLIGAEVAGRACYTMELQPKYVDVIVRRWAAYAGKPAILEATGQTFEEVQAERAAKAA
jgi:DNA modification methylase